jgi:phosphonate transport system substrate-binding protein
MLLYVGSAVADQRPLDPAVPTAAAREHTLVVGVVSSDPKSRLPRLEAMARYLALRLRDLGIQRGAALVARNNKEMVELLREGAVDVLSETAFSAVHFTHEAGAKILLREWKKGVAEYRTVFVTRRDSGIGRLADLRGKKIAFEDPGSTTGFLLPLALLTQHGLETVALSSVMRSSTNGAVGYAFAIKEVNIAAWVARGLADAGAFSDGDWNDLARTPAGLKDDLVIFQESEPVLRSLILARGNLRPEVTRRLTDVLLGMSDDPAGREVMAKYNKVAKYDRIVGAAADTLAVVRRLYPLVVSEIQ